MYCVVMDTTKTLEVYIGDIEWLANIDEKSKPQILLCHFSSDDI